MRGKGRRREGEGEEEEGGEGRGERERKRRGERGGEEGAVTDHVPTAVQDGPRVALLCFGCALPVVAHLPAPDLKGSRDGEMARRAGPGIANRLTLLSHELATR